MTENPTNANNPPARSPEEQQMDAISWALLGGEEGDIFAMHEAGCVAVILDTPCVCKPRIFMVPNTKGWMS
jgi:hypothetical protein